MAVWLFIGALCIFVTDIVLKQAIEERFRLFEEREIFGGAVILRKVYNKGAMLNLFGRYPKVVRAASAVCGVLMLIYDTVLWSGKGRWVSKVGMVFFTGGAWSNICDRLLRGKVIDYFGFRTKWRKITRITFNLGDLFIFLGAILTVLADLFQIKN